MGEKLWSPFYEGDLGLCYTEMERLFLSLAICISPLGSRSWIWLQMASLAFHHAFSEFFRIFLIWIFGFRHVFSDSSCNELRQCRAMMSQDFKSNSSLDAQKNSSHNRLSKNYFSRKFTENFATFFAAKKQTFSAKRTQTFSKLKPVNCENVICFGFNPNFSWESQLVFTE